MQIKILILNPPGNTLIAGTRWSSKISYQATSLKYYPFPTFMGYAASVAIKAGLKVFFIDAVAQEWSREKLLEWLKSNPIDIIFMETSATSFSYDTETIKKFKPPTVAMGSLATAEPARCIANGFSQVIVGEYDYAVRDFSIAFHNGSPLPKNVVSADSPGFERLPPIDINALPYPARDIMPMQNYNEPVAKGRNVVLVSSRGCPLNCSFCTVPPLFGFPNYRFRDPVSVVDEIEYLLETYPCDELYFDDDNMTANAAHVVSLCREIQRRGLRFSWGCMGDATIDVGLFKIMSQAGCTLFKFGVEHFDDEVIKKIPKHIEYSAVDRIIRECKKFGIRSHPTYVVGLPYSSKEKDLDMIKKAVAMRPTTIQFSVATPLPGTRMYELCKKNGWLTTDDWSKFDGAGRSVVSYPQYHWTEITKMNVYAWDSWQKHFLIKQPATVFHHIFGSLRRQGFFHTVRISLVSLLRYLRRYRFFRVLHNRHISIGTAKSTAPLVVTLNNKPLPARRGGRLLDIILRADDLFYHHCDGRGRCCTCIVKIPQQHGCVSLPTDKELELLTKEELSAGFRLSCQTRVSADVAIQSISGNH